LNDQKGTTTVVRSTFILRKRSASSIYCMMDVPISLEQRRSCNDQIQFEPRLPSTQAVNDLTNDYRDLTDLMMKLDVEIGLFNGHMRQIKSNLSDFVGLKVLWDEQVKTIHHETQEFQTDIVPDLTIIEKKK
jgi:hypothetical protein